MVPSSSPLLPMDEFAYALLTPHPLFLILFYSSGKTPSYAKKRQ